MTLDIACHFVAGPGVLVRHGAVAALVFNGGDAAALDAVLALVATSAVAPNPADDLRAGVAAAMATVDPASAPPFAALVADADGVVIVARGPLAVGVSAPTGDTELDARSAPGGLDTRVDGATRIELRWVGTPAVDPDQRYQLTSGVVPAGGMVLIRSAPEPEPVPEPVPAAEPAPLAPPPPPPPPPPPAAVAPPPPPVVAPPPPPPEAVQPHIDEPAEATPPAEVSFESVLLLGLDPGDESITREPLPTAGQGHDHAAEADVVAVEVDGVHCVRDHFNDPNTRYCSVCGISMLQQTLRLRKGSRPPLGVFVFDDGSTFVADTDYVIGRQPDIDDRVRTGVARPLVVTDPQRSTSRVHAEIRLSGWEVTVVDRGSANGTWLLLNGAPTWTRLPADAATKVPTGARVRVGQRHFFYDSHHRV